MDSVLKRGHQIKGEPTIQVCHLLQAFHFIFFCPKKSPSDCFSLYGHFLKINPSSKGFIFVADRFVLLKGYAMMIAETVTHFSQEGGFMDTKFQDVGGIHFY